MSESFNNDFKNSLKTGFIDLNLESESKYRPKLLTNKKIPKEKVLSTIIQEFNSCKAFSISVAFVTSSGIATLFNTLLELEKKGVKGRILVSQYLNFTQPEALRKLIRFKNIELKIAVNSNSHSKGYIFKKDSYHNIIIGSSNLTAAALTVNKEWNLKVSGLHSSEIVDSTLVEFDADFEEAQLVTNSFISEYEIIYNKTRASFVNSTTDDDRELITPNEMQIEALANLKSLRELNKSKALIISATGTGKTYLSAFDVAAFKPKKLLFVVHRLTIAEKALKTFQKIFQHKKIGLFSGNKREVDADFIFSTIQTISREEHLNTFDKEHFDYIIIDESHRSGAESYMRLIEHFSPKFLLGMTATPERTDGNDIFSLFDHNVAYEIRLNRAMEEGMLSQFHYYGITDISVNNEHLDNARDFQLLASEERTAKIIENAKLYGTSNGVTRGLVFCSRNEESKLLAAKFTEKGLKSIALSGENTEQQRIKAISLLESDDNKEKLDYIFTVDIFNEGIDIPKINQIIMIRPTESAIIFVQQLGRGLRKAEGKDYLTVIDFIGNHKNNYLIPIALYGDTTFNKDTLRKLMSEDSKLIPGSSTINFDKISKEKIFQSIDSANMQLLADLKKDYFLLKYRLGRVPMMIDFLDNESRDPFLFADYSRSYYNFILKADKDFESNLPQEALQLLELFSMEINNGKRVEESYILKELVAGTELKLDFFLAKINEKYGYVPTEKTIQSCLNNLNFKFVKKDKEIVKLENDVFSLQRDILTHLKQADFKKFLLDSALYSVASFDKKYSPSLYKNGLVLFNKYSRKDVCRLLNWDTDTSSTVYGYRTKNKMTPCFVTYHKSHDIEDSVNYNDYFISPSVFAWESRSNRKVKSPEIQSVIDSDRILLFVKKGDGEGTDFYFMGDCYIIENSVQQEIMPDSKKPIVHFKFKLEQPVDENIYQYITSNNKQIEQVNEATVQNLEKVNQVKESLKDEKIVTIPLYDFYAAAGNFSEMQSDKSYSQIEVPEKYANNSDYFACEVKGESMNRRIPSGSICVFKKYSGGSRSGKIFLLQNYDIQDQDFNSAFTVKTYFSQKIVSEDGWRHSEIVLKPNSTDASYKDIIISEEDAAGLHTIAEFVEILK